MCLVASAQSMKVVVDSRGEAVGRYLKENAKQYYVEVQDDYWIPKKGHRVVVFSAAKGQGIIWRHPDRHGNINVRQQPNTNSAVIALITEEGDLMEGFPCLGKYGNWYKIRIFGKIGYVRDDMVEWDGMLT